MIATAAQSLADTIGPLSTQQTILVVTVIVALAAVWIALIRS